MKTCAILCLTASAAALPSQLERNALVAQIKDRLALPRCAGPTDATSCAVSRARKLMQHEGFLTELAERHAPEQAGLLRSLLALPRFVATGAAPPAAAAAAAAADPTARRSLAFFDNLPTSTKEQLQPKVQDSFEKFASATLNLANNTCEGRYEALLAKIMRDGDGCTGLLKIGDSNFDSYAPTADSPTPAPTPKPTPAPTPEGGDSCAVGQPTGDSMYWSYTCNYELQPLGCKAQNDALCRTDTPVTARDGNWAERTFANDDCKTPWEVAYNEATHGKDGVGGSEKCTGKWSSQEPERYAEAIASTERMCPAFAARAHLSSLTVSSKTAVETCGQALSRVSRRSAFGSTLAVVVPIKLTGFSYLTFTAGVQLAYRLAVAIQEKTTLDKVALGNIVNPAAAAAAAGAAPGAAAAAAAAAPAAAAAGVRRLNGRALSAAATVEFDLSIYVGSEEDATTMIATVKEQDANPTAFHSQLVAQLLAVKSSGEYADVASMSTDQASMDALVVQPQYSAMKSMKIALKKGEGGEGGGGAIGAIIGGIGVACVAAAFIVHRRSRRSSSQGALQTVDMEQPQMIQATQQMDAQVPPGNPPVDPKTTL